MKKHKILWLTIVLAMMVVAAVSAQTTPRPVVAVLSIDSHGVTADKESVSYIVRLELEKANVYTVMDKYDVAEAIARTKLNIENCFGKNCVVEAGKTLGADKMVTGSIERFGEKIVISLKLIDVKTAIVERNDATEYLNVQPELQRMIAISVQKILGITPDPMIVNLLINYDSPIESPKTKVNLDGPRMGFSIATGETARVLEAAESEGGFNMYPVMFQFGWQKEWQYLSAGDFQALVEVLPMIGGLESGKFIPSLTLLNGFRMGKGGWEFAFGPSFRVIPQVEGFTGDGMFGTTADRWYTTLDWKKLSIADPSLPSTPPYPLSRRLDSRGDYQVSANLFFGIGRTFRSGYLNIPVNLYVIPRREGTTAGFSFGFNLQRKAKVW